MSSPDRISFARDAASGIEGLAARFAGHAYDLHRHDEWLVGVTDNGVQDFLCRGTRQKSTTGRVILIEPQEAHDGQAGAQGGFAYRMLYLPRKWLKRGLRDGQDSDPGFLTTLCDDPALGLAIGHAYVALRQSAEQLRRDAALDSVLDRLRPHLLRPERASANKEAPAIARRARDRLHDALTEDIGADALAKAAGAADRFQLARAFRTAYGTSPHAYRLQTRLLQARQLLATGISPAAVAADCGFADQSHLGRRFRRAYGIAPGAYRLLCTGVPDRQPTMP
ncbi:AraC family transcriptional regulator [Acidisoma cellulosilytica]|uniref:AraC family transcriptional regulator n=1 Tax=Acidisoma cellulosilyticum TaxID=2802395 RepID=A0A963Z4D3_9PROT|nr:AraC family transcriptional regulator [Acidisoma cellulosilyticum]MCB8882523.1 AraC family transcriptional regulator [Acidisoma cellulosilyticum]